MGEVFGGVPAAPGGGRGCFERMRGWVCGGGGVAGTGIVCVIPRRSTKVVEGEVEFFGGEHVCAAEDAVVAD